MLIQFAKSYEFNFRPIAVDAVKAAVFQNGTVDQGEAARWGIRYFPALLVVNRKTHIHQVIAYGYLTEDRLKAQFLDVALNFEGGY